MFDARRVGRRLRQLRTERGLTQEKLAYECGRSKSYLSEIESGKKAPSLVALAEFADRLGVTLYDILVVPGDGARERLIDATRKVPEQVLAELHEALLRRPQ